MEYFFIGRLALASVFFGINIFAMVLERKTVRDKSEFLSNRPVAREALRMLWWIAFMITMASIFVSIGAGIRDYYGADEFVADAPMWAVVIQVLQTLMFYVIVCTPGVALLAIMREIKEIETDWLRQRAEAKEGLIQEEKR